MTNPTEAQVAAALSAYTAELARIASPGGSTAHERCLRAALIAAARLGREQAVRDKIAMQDKAMIPIYGATEAPSDNITVQCKCGWIGKQSALLSLATTSTVMRSCPRCCEKFVAFLSSEPDYGEDVLGLRKGKE
jgi:hypothetical protein